MGTVDFLSGAHVPVAPRPPGAQCDGLRRAAPREGRTARKRRATRLDRRTVGGFLRAERRPTGFERRAPLRKAQTGRPPSGSPPVPSHRYFPPAPSFCPSPPPSPRAQRAPSFERRTVFGDRRTVARRWSDAGPTLRRWPDAGPTLRRSPCQAGAGEGGASVSAGVGLGRRAGRRLGELGRGGGDGVGPLRALHRCREGAWATGGRDAGRDGLV
jgi:hypothetical protein